MASKRLRFEIFKRDDFTCQYCGAKAPDVRIELDHKLPRWAGGADTRENLVTACFECNRGKSGNSLAVSPMGLYLNGWPLEFEIIYEAREMGITYREWLGLTSLDHAIESGDGRFLTLAELAFSERPTKAA